MILSCNICPHNCQLELSQFGKCQIYQNTGFKIENQYYGLCSFIGIEDIEKKPFFHFFPGSKYLAVGLLGCSFSCQFCQSYKVSQEFASTKRLYKSPEDLVNMAIDKSVHGIAFSFNEPTIHYQYIIEVAKIAKANNLRVVIKTNGFANGHVIDDLCKHIDAFNVDIKGDEGDYQDICDGRLRPVLDCIKRINNFGNHLEISYLVMPNSDFEFHKRMADELRKYDCPVHLLYLYPFFKMSLQEPYDKSHLIDVKDMFESKLSHVYISNVYSSLEFKYRDTVCPKCSTTMISRSKSAVVNRISCCDIILKGCFS